MANRNYGLMSSKHSACLYVLENRKKNQFDNKKKKNKFFLDKIEEEKNLIRLNTNLVEMYEFLVDLLIPLNIIQRSSNNDSNGFERIIFSLIIFHIGYSLV